MTAWTSDELNKIAAAEELQIASVRREGTLRNPVTIWVVRHGDGLYVRSVYGRTSSWFRGTQDRHEGHIRAGGVDKDVTFVDADPDIDAEIDAAYRTKYHRNARRSAETLLDFGQKVPRGTRRGPVAQTPDLAAFHGFDLAPVFVCKASDHARRYPRV